MTTAVSSSSEMPTIDVVVVVVVVVVPFSVIIGPQRCREGIEQSLFDFVAVHFGFVVVGRLQVLSER